MADNLPNENQPDDSKLKELEQELQNLEKKAQGELNQQQQQAPAQTQKQATPTPATPVQQTPPQDTASGMPTQDTPPPVANKPSPNQQGGKGSGKGMKIVMWVAVAILLFTLVGAAGYYLGTSNAPSPTPEPTQTPPTASPETSPTADWETYEAEAGWSIRYPETVDVNEGRVVSFMMFGPTQKESTEFYDGISLTARSGALGGLTLMEFVNQKVEEIEGDPVSDVVSGPTSVSISEYSGYRLTTSGFGTFEYYYLPLGESGYLEIIDATQDPTGQGFEETVEMMLNSIITSDVSLSPTPSPTGTATPSATP